jgi:hypothetical protein
MFNSTNTLWDGVGCAPVQKSLFLFNGPAQTSITIPKSKSLTVELWFKLKSSQSDTFTIVKLDA